MSGFRLMKVRHTHIKPISYLYAIYAPSMWLYTKLAFRKEKDLAQRSRNKEFWRPCSRIRALRGVSDAGREKGVATKLRGMRPPKRTKAPGSSFSNRQALQAFL